MLSIFLNCTIHFFNYYISIRNFWSPFAGNKYLLIYDWSPVKISAQNKVIFFFSEEANEDSMQVYLCSSNSSSSNLYNFFYHLQTMIYIYTIWAVEKKNQIINQNIMDSFFFKILNLKYNLFRILSEVFI